MTDAWCSAPCWKEKLCLNETSCAYSLIFVSSKPTFGPPQPERVKRELPPHYPSPSESLSSQWSPSPDAQSDIFDPPGPVNDFFVHFHQMFNISKTSHQLPSKTTKINSSLWMTVSLLQTKFHLQYSEQHNHTWEFHLALVWPNKVQTLGYKLVLGSCDLAQRWWRYIHFKSPMSLEQFCCWY